MTVQRTFSRRGVVSAGLAGALLAPNFPGARALAQTPSQNGAHRGDAARVNATVFGLQPSQTVDQSRALQAAIDQTAAHGLTLALMPGTYLARDVTLRPGTRIEGQAGATVLGYAGGGTFVSGAGAHGARLTGLVFDGAMLPLDGARVRALVQLSDARDVVIDDCVVRQSSRDGIAFERVAGRVTRTTIAAVKGAGLFSLDADTASGAVEIAHCRVHDAMDNGILIWRSAVGADGSRVFATTVERIGNVSGGTGEYGNGINVFRAGGVSVAQCRLTDCAYSAVRGNAASNIQMLGNQVATIGEVALYAEFGFQGAVIANNIIDTAACGIAVTNFDAGGRLAVVQGNLIRNVFRRDHEPVDTRGDGIAVEADAAVSGNVIERAAASGLLIGWGRHMRDVVATGNLVRDARIGIGVTAVAGAGRCLVAQNLISGARDGAIRAMDHATLVGPDLLGETKFHHVVLDGNIAS